MKKAIMVPLVILVAIVSSWLTSKVIDTRAELRAKGGFIALQALLGGVAEHRERTGALPKDLRDPIEEVPEDEAVLRSNLQGYAIHMQVLLDRTDEYCALIIVEAAPNRNNATLVGVCYGKKETDKWVRVWHSYAQGTMR